MATTMQSEFRDEPKQAEQQPAPNPKTKPAEVSGKDKPADKDGKSGIKKAGKILIYAVLGAAALLFVKYKFFTPPEVSVVQVRQQDYTGEVQGTGTVNVDVLAAIGAKIPGRVERVLVNEGDFVHAGQVVATLEDTDIQQVLRRSQAGEEAARMTEQAARATEQSARAAVLSARATAQSRNATKYQTDRAWEREKHLVATGAVSQEEADQYEERDRAASGAVGAADGDIEAARGQVEAAGARVQAARSEIAATLAEVRLQQFNLSQTKIFTYVNGLVTDRPKRAGDAIVSGETVLTVADPTVILVEAYLDQRFAGKIRVGQTATVILRGRAKEPISGRVYRVRPQADPAAEEMTVEIVFPLPPAELEIGQWADIYVQLSRSRNALVLPKTAVTSMGDDRFVLVSGTDNKTRQVRIQSLATSPRSTAMAVSGDLKPGDWVLTQPMGIKPGQKVRANRNPAAQSSVVTSPAMKM